VRIRARSAFSPQRGWRVVALLSLAPFIVGALQPATAFALGDPPQVPRFIVFSRTDASGTHIFEAVPSSVSNLRELTEGSGAADTSPAFSPDGTRIFFTRTTAAGSSVWSMAADGSDQHLVIPNGSHPTWDPTGGRFAYVRNDRDGADIWVANASGWGRTRLTSSPGNDTSPLWIDGHHGIAFVSDRTGPRQVFLMRTDGSHQHRVAPQHAQQSSPTWGFSRGLVFVSNEFGEDDLWQADLDTGTVGALSRSPTFEAQVAIGPDLDFSARIIIVHRRPDGATRLERMTPNSSVIQPVTTWGRHVDRDPNWVPLQGWVTAYDHQAQNDLVEAADAAQSIRDASGSFADADKEAMAWAVRNAFTILDSGDSGEPQEISISPTSTSWAAAAMSTSGTCFFIKITEGMGRTYGMSSAACSGSDAQAAAEQAWPS
jgi:dipeptidyl aminopeptidase/acylaminoacyl peptidase